MKNNYAIIMAGGVGSRFWPFSTQENPKQFLDILGIGKSLIQLTFERLSKVCPKDQIFVVTNDDYADLRAVLNSNDFVYVYFYRSSNLDLDIKAAIEAVANIDQLSFLFIDLDLASSAELFTATEIAHLNLDAEKDNMFLTFDINAQTFELETRSSDIVIEINKL